MHVLHYAKGAWTAISLLPRYTTSFKSRHHGGCSCLPLCVELVKFHICLTWTKTYGNIQVQRMWIVAAKQDFKTFPFVLSVEIKHLIWHLVNLFLQVVWLGFNAVTDLLRKAKQKPALLCASSGRDIQAVSSFSFKHSYHQRDPKILHLAQQLAFFSDAVWELV